MEKRDLETVQYYETVGQVFLGLPGSSPLKLLKKLNQSNGGITEEDFFCSHYETFGRQWPPYHSVFWSLDEEKGYFRSHLFSFFEDEDDFKKRPEFKKESPDHIGLHFLFLSHLLKRELEDPSNKTLRKRQHFFDSYLFPFCKFFLLTLEKESACLFGVLAKDLFKKMMDDFKGPSSNYSPPESAYQEAPYTGTVVPAPSLFNKDLGLKDMTAYLLNPSKVGFFLGQKGLRDCARSCEVPIGFGKRGETLLQLFYTSLDFEKLGALLEALKREVQTWILFYKKKKEELQAFSSYWDILIGRSKRALNFINEVKLFSETKGHDSISF
ncbi:MAG: molecular chaperone TorD family protein [Bdellovibrionota bacterium]|nr:molecular chaperone TorD family protein [Bdellovibrionota bacterium]